MNLKLSKKLGELFWDDVRKLPTAYTIEFKKEVGSINQSNLKVISLSLLILNSILIIIDLMIYNKFQTQRVFYNRLFLLHITMELALPFFILFIFKLKHANNCIKRYVHILFLLFSLAWCCLISIIAQFAHGQISAYIIGTFAAAVFFYLDRIARTIIFISLYSAFILGIIIVSQNFNSLLGSFVNASILLVLTLTVSRLNFQAFLRDFKNKKQIEEHLKEIENLNKSLGEKVEQRTEELVKAQEAVEIEKLRVHFFANISHEFRTPVNVILSAQQLMELKCKDFRDDNTRETVLKGLTPIKQSSYRLLRLISNLIDITKINAGHFELYLKNYNIVLVIDDIVQSVAPFVESKNITIIFDTDIEELEMAFDLDKIERVFLNLISNAVKFTPSGGMITVKIYQSPSVVCISVKDTGIGIPKEMHQAIFDRFVQVEKPFAKKAEGSGIGLSLVKSIIEMHKGSICVNSEENQGAEFIISLPVYKTQTDGMAFYGTGLNQKSVHVEFSDIDQCS